MRSKARLTSENIIGLINDKAMDKGVEVTHISIDESICFAGKVSGKINTNFKGKAKIGQVKDNVLEIQLRDINISTLGFLQGAAMSMVRTLINNLKNPGLEMAGDKIKVDIPKANEAIKEFDVQVHDIYIEEKKLIIDGENLKDYLIS